MSMETSDTPSASADNHGAPGPRGSPLLDADPLQPRALEHLADWEIKELILRLKQNNVAASKPGGRKLKG